MPRGGAGVRRAGLAHAPDDSQRTSGPQHARGARRRSVIGDAAYVSPQFCTLSREPRFRRQARLGPTPGRLRRRPGRSTGRTPASGRRRQPRAERLRLCCRPEGGVRIEACDGPDMAERAPRRDKRRLPSRSTGRVALDAASDRHFSFGATSPESRSRGVTAPWATKQASPLRGRQSRRLASASSPRFACTEGRASAAPSTKRSPVDVMIRACLGSRSLVRTLAAAPRRCGTAVGEIPIQDISAERQRHGIHRGATSTT
jgi:hypothetical protein